MLGVGALVAGFAAFIGFGLSIWRNWIQHRTHLTDSRRLMADSFTKAVEQLGHDEYSIRIGGILALEKIAQSDPKNYHDPVFETLCAYVREKAAWKNATVRENEKKVKPPRDIQLILTVIGRRDPKKDFRKGLVDLHETDLRGAELQSVGFEHADLSGSSLKNANLWNANLGDTNLMFADLSGANLVAAKTKDADFLGVTLEKTCLIGTNLSEVVGLYGSPKKTAIWNEYTIWPPGFKDRDENEEDENP